LTAPGAEHTIAAMQRETLLAILGSVPGLRKDGARYLTQDGQEIAVYVGQPGRAAAVEHVLSITAPETHLEIEARDRGTFYLAYDAVHGVLATPRKERKGAAGGVGF
jgi:hypothetical protein